MADQQRGEPVLITDAQMSYEEELAVRKRRYKWMMGMRIPCMILAAAFYQFPWIAVTLLIVSVPLPWIAVLVANDRLPRTARTPKRYVPQRTELESRPHPVIDTADAPTAESEPSGQGARPADEVPHPRSAGG
ncbi:DUF3099 domain-containing protein [Pseudonocardia phyllosphaerae]|uniref:DUF3099 domain-containing protein n=1 Tax=Pseudonocardia phyllosphaerae TaxID=3390502 RepID=UPI00397CFD50